MFSEAFPILVTADIDRALTFYGGALGGRTTYRFPASGRPVFVTVEIGSSPVGIGEEPGADVGAGPIELCVYAEDCDAAVAHLRGHGATVVSEPADQPWGERMARVLDPDGNRLVIVSRR